MYIILLFRKQTYFNAHKATLTMLTSFNNVNKGPTIDETTSKDGIPFKQICLHIFYTYLRRHLFK